MKLLLLVVVACLAGAAYSEKVVGGTIISYAQAPYQVAMKYSSGSQYCGGSVIDVKGAKNQWVLSAAHCSTTTSNLVAFGNADKNKAQTVGIIKVVNHPDYGKGGSSYNNDIALYKLAKPIDAPEVHAIKLHCDSDTTYLEEKLAWATGWGSTFSGGSTVVDLRGVELRVSNQNKTAYAHGSGWHGSYIDKNMLVAHAREGTTGDKDTCQGDSGGPITQHDDKGNNVDLIGCTSWGYGCGRGGVYTRIASYCDWVEKIIAENP